MAIEEYLIAYKIEQQRDRIEKRNYKNSARKFVRIAELNSQMENHFIKIVIFCAITSEAFINHYAIERISKSYFDKHLDKMDTVSKWIVIPKLITGKQIDSGSEAIQNLRSLIKIRHKLIHPKTRFLTIEQMVEAIFISDEDVKDALRTIGKLSDELFKVDNSININWIKEALFQLAAKTRNK
jgi:hypothetical protein